MIISHSNGFIFFKPRKVAGTSIEIGLSPYCGPKDILTSVSSYNPSWDSSFYIHPKQNCGTKNFFNHITPEKVRKKISVSQWEQYYKFTVVRNPWDVVVSHYHWKRAQRKETLSFETFVREYETIHTNHDFYFDSQDQPVCDFYMRYESLDQDYKTLCERFEIPHHPLPRTKDKIRPKRHYSKYYNKRLKQEIEKRFQLQIDFFGYEFEEPKSLWFTKK